MKRSQRRPREAGRKSPLQFFTYGPLEFNVTRAALLAGNSKKYRPEPRYPAREWIGPHIEINEGHIEKADLAVPVLFVTFFLPGHPPKLLIDGHHRVLKALNHREAVATVTLDLEDTLKVVRGPAHLIEQMKQEGRRLGMVT